MAPRANARKFERYNNNQLRFASILFYLSIAFYLLSAGDLHVTRRFVNVTPFVARAVVFYLCGIKNGAEEIAATNRSDAATAAS